MKKDDRKVEMPAREFVAEHKRLPRVLMDGNRMARRREAKRQAAELREYERDHGKGAKV